MEDKGILDSVDRYVYDDNFYGSLRVAPIAALLWLTPDRLGGDIANPQSLNRYAYALNNPTTLTDPLGLDSQSCSDPNYFFSHAECGGTPGCVAEGSEGCIPYPFGYPIGFPSGGGGGSSTGNTGSPSGPSPTLGDDFRRNPLPCIGPASLTDLAGYIAAGLTSIFGQGSGPSPQAIINANPTLSGPNSSLPVEGGAAVLHIPDITPTYNFDIDVPMLPGFHPGQSAQVYFPVPSTPAARGDGAGTILHVTFNVSLNGAGQVTRVTNVTGHFDIHNPYAAHGLGLGPHIAADLILACFASAAQGGCAVKFQ